MTDCTKIIQAVDTLKYRQYFLSSFCVSSQVFSLQRKTRVSTNVWAFINGSMKRIRDLAL